MDPSFMSKPGRGERKAQQVGYLSLAAHRLLLLHAAPPTALTILELGSGPGYFAILVLFASLSQYCPCDLNAILLDRKGVGLATAKERWDAWCERTHMSASWASKLGIAEQSASDPLPPFDVALGLHTCGPLSDIIFDAAARTPSCFAYVVSPCCYGQIVGRASVYAKEQPREAPPNNNVTNNLHPDIVSHPRSASVREMCQECGVSWNIGLLGTASEMSVVQSSRCGSATEERSGSGAGAKRAQKKSEAGANRARKRSSSRRDHECEAGAGAKRAQKKSEAGAKRAQKRSSSICARFAPARKSSSKRRHLALLLIGPSLAPPEPAKRCRVLCF
jgi:hypothetical protein